MTVVFTRELNQLGMFPIEVGETIRFKYGFNVYDSPLEDKAKARWSSGPMSLVVDSPKSQVQYPYELFSGKQVEKGTGNTEGYEMYGTYSVNAINFLRHEFVWELELIVPDKLEDLNFY